MNDLSRKLKVVDPTLWNHHRGGWNYAMGLLREHLHANDDEAATLCISSVEDYVCDDKPVDEPWIGFVHQVPRTDSRLYPWFPDLDRLTKSEHFVERMLPRCRGLFVLSSIVRDYLATHLRPSVPVTKVWYPATPGGRAFDWDAFVGVASRTVLFVGEYLRNFRAFDDLQLPSNYRKVLLKAPDVDFDRLGVRFGDDVELRERVDDDEYDRLLSQSVVFLNLLDAPANTTAIECLARNCPLVVNRLPGLEEYLGVDYPLFYEGTDLDAAARLVVDDEALRAAVDYMKSSSLKRNLDGIEFVRDVHRSAIYVGLPTPPSLANGPLQQRFCATVVICSYKRVYNIEKILRRFANQQGNPGRFEVMVWNNNYDESANLDGICQSFSETLHLKLIHSTENYYCIIRLAAASLMRSDVMIICDDDVIPRENFVERFLTKYNEYGPNAVLCCRGHVFDDHELDEEKPQQCWEEYENLRFYGQEKDDMQVGRRA